MKKLLVLGIGNILLKDEGIGVFAVQELQKEKWPSEVDFLDGGTFTQDLFYLFENYAHILVLDCVKGGQEPGTIYRLCKEDLLENKDQAISLHDIDLLDSLKMVEMLGKNPELTILGVEPYKLEWHLGLSEEIQAVFPKFLEVVRKEIEKILSALKG
ncbi:MAG TPA: hydrogenase [Desulfonauticus sp.]|jgi:hydrogenase maturation protease|nr:hydrogenase maturation protease [Desulfonauticus sp.]HCO11802.1 hydrogenase [Desulfonauticus sp.]